jgi:hypothetical protein
MGKAVIVTPLYISVAWTLMISYQLFTQTAVYSVIQSFNLILPSFGDWFLAHMDTIVFVHAFAWIWVLSSMIPSVLLGEGKGVLVQFFVCLTLTLTAVWFVDILTSMVGAGFRQYILQLSIWFTNPWVAGLYLSAPYLLMLYVDLHGRRKKKQKEKLEEIVVEAEVEETEAIEDFETEALLEDAEEAEEIVVEAEVEETEAIEE